MSYLEDPLDSADFDPVQYINQRFPTEASLEDLDNFIAGIGSQISTLDEEISKAVQTQSVVGKQASKDIFEAQQSMEDLFEKIKDIKLKASQSESMVQEICADIKKLDYAKNHLQTSITSLNRLQMLVNAVEQLEILAQDYQYKEVANLFDAVKQFMFHFQNYLHIPMISDLQKRVESIRKDLTSHVRSTFRQVAKAVEGVADVDVILANLPGGAKSLSESCLVVDALGYRVRRELLEEFVQMQLIPYENLFGGGKEHYSLEQVDRRWAWFKRLLKYVDTKFTSIFPFHWRLSLRLCLEFIERTKIHFVQLLTEMESKDSSDVHALLKALQSSLRFEQELSDKFNLLPDLQSFNKELEEKAKKNIKSVEIQKLKKDDKLMYVPTDHHAINQEDESESGFLSLANSAICGGISGVFDKFLGLYVLLERQNLEDMLQRLSQEEDTASEGVGMGVGGGGTKSVGTHGNVYGSSTNMFVFIKNSIKRCTALTTGQTFLSLSKEFKTCMQHYVELLRNRCPSATSLGAGQAVVYRVPKGLEVGICYLVNTGEYCAEVVPQLELMVQQKLNPSLVSKVDFTSEVDGFMDLAAYSLKVLVSGIMDRLEPSFKSMQSINWGDATQVGEESSYLHYCNGVLLECMPKIRSALSPPYFSNFCTKIATEILQRYLEIILRQKRISEDATQQLLLDTYNIKTLMLQLPQLTPTGESSGSSGVNKVPQSSPLYMKLVNNKVAHIEMILKLVSTPEELLLERFKIMWPDGQPSDLQLIMSLKGTKRNDQQVILEMLGLSAAGKLFNKTASNIFTGGNASNTGNPNNFQSSATNNQSSYSMKNLTQDLSSTARNIGNLKWSTSGKS